tara:strand:+ start:1349 stop:1738 length:390 start_codon:yes stop_codon:yes gene_type:complete
LVFEVNDGTKQIKDKNMRTLNDYFITAEIEDVSTVSSTFVAIPDGGKIVKILTANQATITGTAALSFEIGGTAVTGGGISIVASGSAGAVDTAAPTGNNTVVEGGSIEMITDGGSTNTSKAVVTFVIRR